MVYSYCYWNAWFHNEENRVDISKLEEQGYSWRMDSEKYNAMLNGRVCPICHNQGFIVVHPTVIHGIELREVFCLCKILDMIDEPYQIESWWEPRFLDEYDTKFGDKNLLKQVEMFAEFPLGWHYLYGGLGSGKTMMLYIIKEYLRGMAMYLTTADLNEQVFKAVRNHNLDELIDQVAGAEVLLLDDFGAEYSSEFFFSTLYTIINRRYSRHERYPTFFTSNLTFKELAGSSSMEMKRIVDRISDTNFVNVLVVKQSSYRQRKVAS
jgi:hypothetical protein